MFIHVSLFQILIVHVLSTLRYSLTNRRFNISIYLLSLQKNGYATNIKKKTFFVIETW